MREVEESVFIVIALFRYMKKRWKEKKMRDLTQLNKLEQYLKDNNIPYERFDNEDIPLSPTITYAFKEMERHQICVPGYSSHIREWDVICQRGSHGAEEGLLELYGTIVAPNAGDSVEGWLTADDVIARIEGRRG